MNLSSENETTRAPYDAGIAWRVSVEMPCAADWDVAPHVATRLADRLVLESQLCVDVLDDLEDAVSSGGMTAGEAVREAARGAGRRLEVPGEEVVLALCRVGVGASDPEACERGRARLVRELSTPARRAQTREWAAGFLEETDGRVPLLAAAVAEAAEASLDSDPATDELWVGATLGLLLQHEAWRVDGPHTNELHPVRGPF